MNYSCNGHIPGGVSGHAKTKKRPNSVVVERGYEDSGSTTSSKYVGPCPLVQMIIYVVYITAYIYNTKNVKIQLICIEVMDKNLDGKD